MSEDVYIIAKDNDLSFDEANELQEFADEHSLDADEAYELWQDQ